MSNDVIRASTFASRVKIDGKWLPALTDQNRDGDYAHLVFYAFCDREWLQSIAPDGSAHEFDDPLGYVVSHTTDESMINLYPTINEQVSRELVRMFTDAQAMISVKYPVSECYLAVTPAAFRAIIEHFDSRVLTLGFEHALNYEVRSGQRLAGNVVQSFTRYIAINGYRLRYIPFELPRYAWIEHKGFGITSWNTAVQS